MKQKNKLQSAQKGMRSLLMKWKLQNQRFWYMEICMVVFLDT